MMKMMKQHKFNVRDDVRWMDRWMDGPHKPQRALVRIMWSSPQRRKNCCYKYAIAGIE